MNKRKLNDEQRLISRKKAVKKYYESHKVQRDLSSKKWREENKERYKQLIHENYIRNKTRYNKQNIENGKKRRLEVLMHYSKGKLICACCEEDMYDFLTIDHIHNNGAEDRRTKGNKQYLFLIRENFPEGYQILCMNCNFAKGIYGSCPHSRMIK